MGFYLANPGGAGEVRTPDPLRARQVLSQLSYNPFSPSGKNSRNKLCGHLKECLLSILRR
jgi:hypothetical protein